LRSIFSKIGSLDFAFANAGISETENFLADTVEVTPAEHSHQNGLKGGISDSLKEPSYPLLDVNFKAVLNVVKLAHHSFKRDGKQGAIVLTSSATAYAPEQSLPVYSAVKLALVGLVRSLRHNLICDGITINAVVPACTETALVGAEFLGPIKDMGLPVSSARMVGAALVHSAVAKEARKVDVYGKEPLENVKLPGRWNGRVILTLGDTYTELEEKLADLRPQWFGEENAVMTRTGCIYTFVSIRPTIV
jgi:NAD(P)-dependent dehydrogenase (short-subunit alcohol dehydrogenase family)